MRILAIILGVVFLLSLVGCGSSGTITGSGPDQSTMNQTADKPPIPDNPPPPGDPDDLGGGFRQGG